MPNCLIVLIVCGGHFGFMLIRPLISYFFNSHSSSFIKGTTIFYHFSNVCPVEKESSNS